MLFVRSLVENAWEMSISTASATDVDMEHEAIFLQVSRMRRGQSATLLSASYTSKLPEGRVLRLPTTPKKQYILISYRRIPSWLALLDVSSM